MDGNTLEVKGGIMSAKCDQITFFGGGDIALPIETGRAVDGGLGAVGGGHLEQDYGRKIKKVKKKINPAMAAGED